MIEIEKVFNWKKGIQNRLILIGPVSSWTYCVMNWIFTFLVRKVRNKAVFSVLKYEFDEFKIVLQNDIHQRVPAFRIYYVQSEAFVRIL